MIYCETCKVWHGNSHKAHVVTFDIQLLDRINGTWWTWDHNLTKEVADAVEAGARENGEVTRRVVHDDTPRVEDLI